MKRSPTCISSPSSSASSSSACLTSDSPIQSEALRPKRAKRTKKSSASDKSQNPTSSGSGKRSSIYRGVTRHRWTGRFEAHLWDKSSWNSIQNKKGKQVYLGAYDSEEAAARTYDLAALKYWGPETILNFPLETYTEELQEMQRVTKEEYLASLRRQSSGFSRGVSKYRGVARHHHNGRWEARIGRVFGNKYLYLGTYNTQEEAAAAYDMAAIEYRGANAVTNFDISNYIDRLKKKGIFPFPVNQTQEPVLDSSLAMADPKQIIETREVKAEPPQQELQEYVQLPKQHQEDQQEEYDQIEELQYMDSSAIVGMEPPDNNSNSSNSNNNELAWSFCMDTGLAPFLTDEKLPTEKNLEFSELLDEIGFEDNIDFMFDEVKPECLMLENPSCCGVDEVIISSERSSLSSSSPSPSSSPSSSTTTSVFL